MGQYLSSYFYGTSTVRPPISHVIFDFDGILVDSEKQYSKAMKMCVEPHGKEFTLDQKLKIMGRKKPGESFWKRLIQLLINLRYLISLLFYKLTLTPYFRCNSTSTWVQRSHRKINPWRDDGNLRRLFGRCVVGLSGFAGSRPPNWSLAQEQCSNGHLHRIGCDRIRAKGKHITYFPTSNHF